MNHEPTFRFALSLINRIRGEQMRPVFFTTESQAPAAYLISNCFEAIKKTMQVESLQKYTDCLDDIAIIPFCIDEEYMEILQMKERKYVSWKNRYADIRLRMNFDMFVRATKEERMQKCKEVILCSLDIIKRKCEAKKLRFDIDALIHDIFPNDCLPAR